MYETRIPVLTETRTLLTEFVSSIIAPRIVKKKITKSPRISASVYRHRSSLWAPCFFISFIISLDVAPTKMVTDAKIKPEIVAEQEGNGIMQEIQSNKKMTAYI